MRFSHISLGALALAIATPALADPLPAAAGSPTTNDAGTPAVDPMTPVDAPVTPAAPADDAPAKAKSAFTVTGGVTLISDYRFRGLTQSDGRPALQGTLGVSHSSGLYIGTWASMIDGGLDGSTPALRGYGDEEIDLYGGFTKTLPSGFGFDVGLLYYYYASRKSGFNTDFFEPYASVNYTIGPVNAKVGGNYAWSGQKGLDFTSGGDDDIYVYGELAVGVPKTPITLKGHLGYTSGSLGLVNLDSADDNYMDWSLTAEAAVRGLKVGVSYVGTDISNANGVYAKGSEVLTGKFAQVYGRGSTVLAYVGYSF